ncbi:Gfo/Idh/MocA family protein [Bauldia sp.]|uniref:Gfo/Idh/MocA family protein n=1 Tax=Bauldia sp. TaxID=2575872 RepID=UPI003BAA26D9
MTIRVGLIGAGVMGADHASILTAAVGGSTVAAVSDADSDRAKAVADVSGATVIDDPLDLIIDERVDAVLIASPDPTHKPLTLACLATGKPVLCEKPLAETAAECREIVDAEVALGQQLIQVGFMRRFDPGYVAMKERYATDDLGTALILHCIHRNAAALSYTNSETLFANSAVHEFDISRWLLEDDIARVSVVTPRSSALANMVDPQIILCHMAGGAIVDAEVFMNAQYGYDVDAELVCERGTISLRPPADIRLKQEGIAGVGRSADWRPRFAAAYRQELQAWIGAIREGTTVGASAWDGFAATAVAEAGLEALKTGAPADVRMGDRPGLYA